jgi:RNA polymerase sigma factor (sigma-70 family)
VLSDSQLLQRFAQTGEEAAFQILLQRHGPMVLGVCRRLLADANDADDAFQATFLVMIRKAGSLIVWGSLASWLYGVAYRTALKARTEAARRWRHERRAAEATQVDPAASELVVSDLRQVLDQELSRLPEKYRAPLVLCYLKGKTNEEAARLLGWPAGSMSRRLAKGRELLRERLLQRGVEVTGVAIATAVAESAAPAAVPATLAQAMLQVASLTAAGQAMAEPAVLLMDSVLKQMVYSKVKSAVGLLLLVCTVARWSSWKWLKANPRRRGLVPSASLGGWSTTGSKTTRRGTIPRTGFSKPVPDDRPCGRKKLGACSRNS